MEHNAAIAIFGIMSVLIAALVFYILVLVDEQIRESQLERKKENGELASFGEKYSGQYDQDIYGRDDRGAF